MRSGDCTGGCGMVCKQFKLYIMNEHLMQRDTTSVSGESELLKVLIDKTVDNGRAILDTQEMIRKLHPGEMAAGMDRRMGELEERVGGAVTATGERVGGAVTAMGGRVEEMAMKIDTIGNGVAVMKAQLGEPNGWLMDTMRDLRVSLEGFKEFFSNPIKKEVHIRHF